MSAELFEGALKLAQRGWHVFPCKPGEKQPATANGLNDATTQWRQIINWWNKVGQCNIGVRTGGTSGIVVLDVDGDEGHASLRQLEDEHGKLPRTLSVVTPSGGQHFYFQHPEPGQLLIRNSASKIGAKLDIRGDGGYVLAPPSQLKGGRKYEVDERAPIAPLPQWLFDLNQRGQQPGETVDASEWVGMMRDGVQEGGRNHAIARLIGHLLRRYVDVAVTREVAHLVNTHRFKPAMPAWEVDRTFESVLSREMQRRAEEEQS